MVFTRKDGIFRCELAVNVSGRVGFSIPDQLKGSPTESPSVKIKVHSFRRFPASDGMGCNGTTEVTNDATGGSKETEIQYTIQKI